MANQKRGLKRQVAVRAPRKIRVAELFAGVGGFRLGLEGWQGKSALSGYTRRKRNKFEVIWSNQWEPKEQVQTASKLYVRRFGNAGHSNVDISLVGAAEIPEHDMLVAGFPCQDYSVAKGLKHSMGIKGEKGILWWEIYRILADKVKGGQPVKYLLLENVDRLLKSPANARGRDFKTILASLHELGYTVEWRVINAADYGFPQRRKRVYIAGYYRTTDIANKILQGDRKAWIQRTGLLAKAFPVKAVDAIDEISILHENKDISFGDVGLMVDGKAYAVKAQREYNGESKYLQDVLQDESQVSNSFYLDSESIDRWQYLKGAKRHVRLHRQSGNTYVYAEGAVPFPDQTDRPSRTIVTSEGGATPSRCKHVIADGTGRFRRLTPLELERLNAFPDNFTAGLPDTKRAFLMGNAVVVGIVEQIGNALAKLIEKHG